MTKPKGMPIEIPSQVIDAFLMMHGVHPKEGDELIRWLDEAGFRIVPKEPTQDMVQAAIWALDHWREKHGNVQGFVPPGDKHQIRWRAMLAAAHHGHS